MTEQATAPAIDSTDFEQFKAAVAATKEPAADNTKVIDKAADDNTGVIEPTAEEKAAKEAADKKAADEAAAAEADANLSDEEKAAKEAAAKKAADDAKKPKKSVSERIAEFRRSLTDAQEQAAIEAAETERQRIRAEKAEAELEAARSGKKPEASKKDYVPEEGEPNPQDYEFGVIDPAFVRDLTDFKVKKQMEGAQKTAAATAEQREVLTKFEGVVAKGLDKYDDYLQVVLEGADQGKWRLTPVAAQALLDMDLGHEVAYHLAKNPAEAAVIAEMPPHRQLLALGRLEARFATEAAAASGASNENDETDDEPAAGAQTQQTPKVSAAPIPPKKVTKGNEGQFTASPDTKDFGAYRRLVEKAQARK